jgi:hypothetical protein
MMKRGRKESKEGTQMKGRMDFPHSPHPLDPTIYSIRNSPTRQRQGSGERREKEKTGKKAIEPLSVIPLRLPCSLGLPMLR